MAPPGSDGGAPQTTRGGIFGRSAERNLVIGALSLGIGLAVTVVSGHVIAYGAIVVGVFELIVGGGQLYARTSKARLGDAAASVGAAGGVAAVAVGPPGWDAPRAESADDERWSFALAMAVAAGIILPLIGAVGYFDPWETHYAEVAREMVVRDDFLYPYWKDSYFHSKPILLFWLTAPLYALLGAGDPQGAMPALAELCGRLPSALSSLFCIACVYFAARRLWSRRAALYSSIALATMPFWAFLSRQAITDMLYVAPASAALLLLAVALFDDADDAPARWGAQARLPLGLTIFAGLCTIPQLWEIGRSGAFLDRVSIAGSHLAPRVATSVGLCVFAVAVLFVLHRWARDPLLHLAAILFALSALAKGPVGIAICGLALVVTIAILQEWHRLARPAAVTATALFLLVAAPWPAVMTAFHGLDEQRKTWFQRFVLYDLLGRVGGGAHGDRGSFEYYLRYTGFGLFAWTGLLPAALFGAAADDDGARGRTPAARFTLLVALWAVVTFAFFSATTTKFHHYILPLCVPAALLIGRFLDKQIARAPSALVAIVTVLIALLIGRDLVTEPWQLVDLFTYHYKSYKPEYYFPSDDEWRVGLSIACFGCAALVAAGAVADFVRPWWTPRAWLSRLLVGNGGPSAGFVSALLLAAVLFGVFAVQVHFNRASQHWSQRAIMNTYLSMKQGDEPFIAFQMDWKGETFYSKNQDIQIKKSGADLKKAIDRPGREFVIVQTDRFGGLKTALGKDYESRISVVDRSNVKWYLVLVDE